MVPEASLVSMRTAISTVLSPTQPPSGTMDSEKGDSPPEVDILASKRLSELKVCRSMTSEPVAKLKDA